jgi:AAA family ATP:ADP antiporter
MLRSDRPGPLDRVLRLFTEVRPGEATTALLLTLNVFLILTAYYVAKVLREPLILAGGGAEIKSYSAAGQALLLLGAVPLYGALAGRVPRRRLINLVTAFFVVCLGVFFLLARAGVPIGIPFFLWVGIFNVMIVAQFWSFANDVYTEEEGKRLFPIVGFGASAGAVLGSWIAGQLIGPIGLHQLFLVSAGLLVLATALTNLVDMRERRRTEADAAPALTSGFLPAATEQFRAVTGEFRAVADSAAYQRESGTSFPTLKRGQTLEDAERARLRSSAGAFRLVFRNRYLLLIALLILLLNWVNTTGEYILSRTVASAAADAVRAGGAGTVSEQAFIGAFYSSFFSVVNVAGLVLQLFVVSRILKYGGVRVAILILPFIALTGYAILAFYPILAVVRWAKIAENSTDYSLNNTVRNVLFLPTTREEKYKAKQAIDSFFHRSGDVLQAVLVYVGTSIFAFETRDFAIVNLALVVIWVALAILVGRRYGRLAAVTVS